jgi:hypothetical protein
MMPDSVRLKRDKSEPANQTLLTRLIPEGLYRLFEQVRPTAPDTPVAAYVDVDRLDAVLQLRDEYKLWGGIIGRTVACFSVDALMGCRIAV